MNKRKTLLSGRYVCCLLMAFGLRMMAQTPVTIAHRLLAMEQLQAPAPIQNSCLANLNALLSKAKERISLAQTAITTTTQAQAVFLQIDSLLSEQGFFTCIKVEYLSQCLQKQTLAQLDCRLHMTTHYRQEQLNKKDSVFKMDCDIGSMLVMSIAQALQLPVFMVEVPKHNFVRWQFADGTYLNWDINEAKSFSNDAYRHGSTSATYLGFDSIAEKRFSYLSNLDTTHVQAYYAYVLGRNYKRQHNYAAASFYYRLSINKLPAQPLPKMCLAYLLTFHQTPKNKSDLEYANQLALEAASVCPNDRVYLETLACSYARLGKYDEALQTILQSSTPKSELIQAFKNKKTGLEVYKPVD